MRATTLFNRLLDLPGTSVSEVTFASGVVSVTVSLRRRRLLCPCCDYWTSAVYDTRPGLTRDFEELVAYFATKTDKTAITRNLSTCFRNSHTPHGGSRRSRFRFQHEVPR